MCKGRDCCGCGCECLYSDEETLDDNELPQEDSTQDIKSLDYADQDMKLPDKRIFLEKK